MKKQLTFSQYRLIDLSIMAVMLIVFEYLITSAAIRWFPEQPYTVSVVAPVVAIVMMRWGWPAAVHAVLGGAVYCFFSEAKPEHYLIYCVGNLLAMLSMLLLRYVGKEKLRKDNLLSLLFALLVQLGMQVGRGAVAVILGETIRNCFGFITTDALSALFTLVIIWIARRVDGLFEDQKSYLLRIQEESEKERGV